MSKEDCSKIEDAKDIKEDRDEELDIANAVEKAQDVMRNIIGNLSAHQFKLEQIKKNGSNTRYIIVCSVIPDLGQDRDYYFIKIDVEDGKIIPPMGKGILASGEFQFKEIKIDPKWEE